MAPDPQSPADRFHAHLAAALASPLEHSTTRALEHLPLLPPADSHTLTTYLFTHNANLPAAAAALEIRATDLNTFLHLPHIAAHLAALEAAQAKHDIRAALDTLKHAATTPDSPPEPRRAATAILRFYTNQLKPRAPRTTNDPENNTPRAHSRATGSAGSAAVPVSTSSTSSRPVTDTASRTENKESSATEASKTPAPSVLLDPSDLLDLSEPSPPLEHSTTRALDHFPPDLPAWLEARRAEHEATAKRYHDEAQEMLRELAYASAHRRGVDLSKEDPIATYVFRGKLLSPIINKRINRSRPPPRVRYRIPA